EQCDSNSPTYQLTHQHHTCYASWTLQSNDNSISFTAGCMYNDYFFVRLMCGTNQTNRYIVCCSQRDYCTLTTRQPSEQNSDGRIRSDQSLTALLDEFSTTLPLLMQRTLARHITLEKVIDAGRYGSVHLGKAFDDLDFIPSFILCRLKEVFSDDVFTKKKTKSLYQYMQEYADTQMSDNDFQRASILYTRNTSKTKEVFLYR
ncbi:unnamed protein product, partial [Rotaria sordida]